MIINRYYELNLILEQKLFSSRYFKKSARVNNYCTDGQYFSRIWNEILKDKNVNDIVIKDSRNGAIVSIYGKDNFVENVYANTKELALCCCYLLYIGYDLDMNKINKSKKK